MRNAIRTTIVALLIAGGAGTAVAQDDGFLRGRLFQIAREVSPEMNPLGEVRSFSPSTGDVEALSYDLEPAHCYTWIGVTAEGTGDIDLTLSSASSAVLSADDAPDDWPVVMYCSGQAQTVTLTLTVPSASGQVAIAAYQTDVGGADQTETYIHYFSRAYGLDGRGSGMSGGAINRVELAPNTERRVPLGLEADHCYTIVGAAGDDVPDFDILWEDVEGNLLAVGDAPGSFPLLDFCAPENIQSVLRFMGVQGTGQVGYQIYSLEL
ncbi:MAG: hypothetical protein KC561_14650 [Myxococcales bacterium]|nr:hypothetical protein [Myxococcales bacterium]